MSHGGFCNRRFTELGNLVVHAKIHRNEKLFACQFCDHRFVTNGNRLDHERRHFNARPFACKHCPQKYYRHFQLAKHLKSVHNKNE